MISRNEHDVHSKLVQQHVVRLFRKQSDHLQILEVLANHGRIEVLRATDNHEFWVHGRGWTRAGNIEIGALLSRPDGSQVTLLSSIREEYPTGVGVYNIEVAQSHTYFVTDGDALDSGIWVHNTQSCQDGEYAPGAEMAERDALSDMMYEDIAELDSHERSFYSSPHANSLDSLQPAQGYVLVDRVSGEPLKYGMTTDGEGRYSQAWLDANNAEMQFVEEGSVREMRAWENGQILDYFSSTGQLPPCNWNFH